LSSTRTTRRLRIFAGPNGSGKTTIINSIRNLKISGFPIDFGIYINADEIAKTLRGGKFSFREYGLTKVSRSHFINSTLKSGLVNSSFNEKSFNKCFTLNQRGSILLRDSSADEHLAQIIAEYLRTRLLNEGRKFSFETVFSHKSKIEFMKLAESRGYKIYLYFVSTESPEINISRVKDIRIRDGGHDVPAGKIKSRYYRTMDLLFDAAQLTYQAYFFDNSALFEGAASDASPAPFAHFKVVGGEKVWDKIDQATVPNWFIKYYSEKAAKLKS